MKTIGLIGGMSWESTATYYKLINEGIKDRLGGLHSADILLRSVDFEPMEELQRTARWDEAATFLIDVAQRLEEAGADLILICTNTMHIVAPMIEEQIGVPLLHIADSAGDTMKRAGIRRAGLLGTKFTMQQDFYKTRIQDSFGVEMIVPAEDDQDVIHSVIYDELCLGEINDDSRRRFLQVIDSLANRGAEGVVLGCTEIPLLVAEKDSITPLFDTTRIHAQAAVEAALR